jgi:TonB family protein
VTLRIHIDASGAVRPESTSVVESSGYAALDSAAVSGSRALHFKPAFAKGSPLAISVLFPVYFRHPQAAPLPGDTLLKPKH